MNELVSQTTQRARKEHTCQDCDQPINKGEVYVRQFIKDCGDGWTYKAHEDCHKVSWIIFREAGLSYGDEWLGMAVQSSEDWEWRRSIAAHLRSKPEYIEVRKRMIKTRLRWRESRKARIASRLKQSQNHPQPIGV